MHTKLVIISLAILLSSCGGEEETSVSNVDEQGQQSALGATNGDAQAKLEPTMDESLGQEKAIESVEEASVSEQTLSTLPAETVTIAAQSHEKIEEAIDNTSSEAEAMPEVIELNVKEVSVETINVADNTEKMIDAVSPGDVSNDAGGAGPMVTETDLEERNTVELEVVDEAEEIVATSSAETISRAEAAEKIEAAIEATHLAGQQALEKSKEIGISALIAAKSALKATEQARQDAMSKSEAIGLVAKNKSDELLAASKEASQAVMVKGKELGDVLAHRTTEVVDQARAAGKDLISRGKAMLEERTEVEGASVNTKDSELDQAQNKTPTSTVSIIERGQMDEAEGQRIEMGEEGAKGEDSELDQADNRVPTSTVSIIERGQMDEAAKHDATEGQSIEMSEERIDVRDSALDEVQNEVPTSTDSMMKPGQLDAVTKHDAEESKRLEVNEQWLEPGMAKKAFGELALQLKSTLRSLERSAGKGLIDSGNAMLEKGNEIEGLPINTKDAAFDQVQNKAPTSTISIMGRGQADEATEHQSMEISEERHTSGMTKTALNELVLKLEGALKSLESAAGEGRNAATKMGDATTQ